MLSLADDEAALGHGGTRSRGDYGTVLATTGVNRHNVFYGCLAIYGLTFGIGAAIDLHAGRTGVPVLVSGVAGVGMFLAAVYEGWTGSAAEFAVGDLAFWAVVVGVVAVVGGHVLEVV